MSRAFVSDDALENSVAVVPPRAPLPAGVANYVTPRGLHLLREEKAALEAERAAVEAHRTGSDTDRARRLSTLNQQLAQIVERLGIARLVPPNPALKEVRRIVQIFRELRSGRTVDGKTQLKSPSSSLSTAEVISVINNGMALAGHFGDGVLHPHDVAAGLIGAVIKDPVQDAVVWKEYLDIVVKEREDWKSLYRACKELE